VPDERFDTVYLDLDDVLDAYAAALGCTPEEAREQIRSLDGLESALAQPQHYAFYNRDDPALSDLSMQAAVLARGISENQPFVEGNKRTALVATATFLAYNAWTNQRFKR
jgi:death-on-curing protein